MGMAIHSLKVFIQAPGLGNQRATRGKKAKQQEWQGHTEAQSGEDSQCNGARGWIIANPSAIPINGAVHGLAMTTARTPVANELCCC